MLVLAPPGLAVMGDDASPPAAADASDPDYTAGVKAWRAEDWRGVIEHMSRVLERRPWNDNAQNLLGFAYRKLGDYPRALEHYQKALDLNPHHRGALEYLGEAYLELDRPAQAAEMLQRLETECRRVASAAEDWMKDCEEWQDLRAAIEAYRKAGQPQ